MNKPIIVITHERSGTHLLINIINYKKNGEFLTIGYIPSNVPYTLENYKHAAYKDVITNSYISNTVSKSHHQVEFMYSYLDFLFDRYHVIYLKRDIKDVLVSYYKFIPCSKDLETFPKIEDWIFMKPDDIGRKFLLPYCPDPHIIIEPKNYIDRYLLHVNGWLKHADNMLVLNYEDILNNFKTEKDKIETYIKRKIGDAIPDINDKNLPNFSPNKGISGAYKEYMSNDLIDTINNITFIKK